MELTRTLQELVTDLSLELDEDVMQLEAEEHALKQRLRDSGTWSLASGTMVLIFSWTCIMLAL